MDAKEIIFWILFPFRVTAGMIRDEIEFYKIICHYTKDKPFKDVEL